MASDDCREPARYFPIRPEPFRMAPGLFRFGTDFGNGADDGLYFQRDRTFAEFVAEKRRIFAAHPDRLALVEESSTLELRERASAWMREELAGKGAGIPSGARRGTREDFAALSLAMQEDFALLERRATGSDRLVALSVCFPSGWEPERLLGRSFLQLHAPIPEFHDVERSSSKLVEAMVHRGPYVRFVWTLVADARLDHHPTQAPRDEWCEESQGFLRVERQLTIPFPAHGGSLFLIRTYVYALESLEDAERKTLRLALERMPESIRRYKGLEGFPAKLLR